MSDLREKVESTETYKTSEEKHSLIEEISKWFYDLPKGEYHFDIKQGWHNHQFKVWKFRNHVSIRNRNYFLKTFQTLYQEDLELIKHIFENKDKVMANLRFIEDDEF